MPSAPSAPSAPPAPSWEVCGEWAVVAVLCLEFSCIEANSSSICSDVSSLLNASVWSLLNSIIASIRLWMTPVSTSVCK